MDLKEYFKPTYRKLDIFALLAIFLTPCLSYIECGVSCLTYSNVTLIQAIAAMIGMVAYISAKIDIKIQYTLNPFRFAGFAIAWYIVACILVAEYAKYKKGKTQAHRRRA